MSTTISLPDTFVMRHCNEEGCGETYAVPQSVFTRWQQTHETFYCPRGHQRHFALGSSDKEKLEQQLAQARQKIDFVETDLRIARESRDAAERSAHVIKGHTTRLKKRIACGICPCCKRSFQNLHEHMKGQHPDYTNT